MSSPVKDTPPTFAEQQMLEKQRRYSQLLEDEGRDEVAGYTCSTLEAVALGPSSGAARRLDAARRSVGSRRVKRTTMILESGLCNL